MPESECVKYGHEWIEEIEYKWNTGNDEIIVVCAQCGRVR